MTSARPRGDTGSGSVLVLGLVAAVLVLTSALGLVARGHAARQGVQAAADLAALAAAGSVALPAGVQWSEGGESRTGPGIGCGLAVTVAGRNGAAVERCTVTAAGVATVTAVRHLSWGSARATARAGPSWARAPNG